LDSSQRLRADAAPAVASLGHTNTFVYDVRGNVTFITNALNIVSAMGYDTNTNYKVAETNALGTAQETWALYTHDQNGYQTKIVSSPNHTNSFTHDAIGNPLTQTDPLGNVTANGYDGFGNLTNTIQLDSQSNVVAQSFSHYLDSRLVATLDANLQTNATFAYDSLGNLTSTTDANNVTRSFTYDANGNQTSSYFLRAACGLIPSSQVTQALSSFRAASGVALAHAPRKRHAA
jgi:YD repeat-containing protein